MKKLRLKKQSEQLNLSRQINSAYKIAVRDLRNCYSSFGILAGRMRFDDYWARDSFFASLGSNKIGDFDIVKANLSLFLNFLNAEGQLPRRVDRGYVPWKYILKWFNIKLRRKILAPRYSTSILISKSADQNSLFIIALLEYVRHSHNYSFVQQNFAKIKRAMDWNFSLADKDGLLNEGLFAGWEDNVIKKGKVIYTNVLHYKALKDFAQLSHIAKKEKLVLSYFKEAERVKNSINKAFWNGIYYIGWIGLKKQNYFCADGNLLAIIFGLANREKAESIRVALNNLRSSNPPLRNNYPFYPFWRLLPSRFFNRTSGYHNGFSWLWLGCLDAVARVKLGFKAEALDIIKRMSEVTNKEGFIYEVYKDGRHVENKFFRCEVPFAWSAGLFVYTVHLFLDRRK